MAKESTADFVILDRWLFDADCYAYFRGMTRGTHPREMRPDIQILLTADIQAIRGRLEHRSISNVYYKEDALTALQNIMIAEAKKRRHATFTHVLENTTPIVGNRWELLTYLIAGDITDDEYVCQSASLCP